MNSRRLMGPSAGGFAAYHTAVGNAALCITAKLIIEWQSWVIRVDLASGASPLVSRFQTYQAGCLSDVLCQQRSSSSSRNGVYGTGGHSGLMPANLITLAHFRVSSAMILPNSAGDVALARNPRSSYFALM